MKAKTTSHIGMIIGAIGLVITFIVCLLKFYFKDFTLNTEQALGLIIIGCSPSIPFCPIYISTWLDKINEIKNGKKEE